MVLSLLIKKQNEVTKFYYYPELHSIESNSQIAAHIVRLPPKENTFMKAPSSDLRYHHQRYIHRSFSDYL